MSTAAFKILDILSTGWKGFKNNMKFLILPYLVYFAGATICFGLIFILIFSSGILPYNTSEPAMIGSSILLILFSVFIYFAIILFAIYFSVVITRISISIVKKQMLSWQILKVKFIDYLRYLAVWILYMLAVSAAGFIISIPFLILYFIFIAASYSALATAVLILGCLIALFAIITVSIFFAQSIYMIADKDKNFGIIEVFKKSWEVMIPNFWKYLLFIITLIAIAAAAIILTALALGIIFIIAKSLFLTAETRIITFIFYFISSILLNIFVGLPILVACAEFYRKLMVSKNFLPENTYN